MQVLEEIYKKAKSCSRRIVLPEASDERVLKAIPDIISKQLAKPILIADESKLKKRAKSLNVDIGQMDIVDNCKADDLQEFAEAYYQKRKHRGITHEDAVKIMKNPLFYAAMMVSCGKADGYVAGAANTSGDVARSALHCVGVNEEMKTLSSAFIMVVPECKYGQNGIFIFADCGIIPEPNPRQLACIAINSAELLKRVFDITPKVALLSYSTKGSAKGPLIEKVTKAVEIAKSKEPNLILDGEIQADAAIVPEVADIKCPNNTLCGEANVIIFPSLEAGNISYKLVQRLAKAKAIGPLLLGLKKPASDLSRGCSIQDVINTVAVTAIRN